MFLKATSAAAVAIGLAVLAGVAFAAQDKYTVQVPNGLAFSDFRGYGDWQVVSIAQTDEVLKVIVANPAMIAAYKAGVPANGQKFPRRFQDCEDPVETEKEHGGAVRRHCTRYLAGRVFH